MHRQQDGVEEVLRDKKTTSQQDKETIRRRDKMGRSFENLYVWQESRELINTIYKIMSGCRDYGFKDQIQRAAVSIMNVFVKPDAQNQTCLSYAMARKRLIY